jgi:hypothetical protein
MTTTEVIETVNANAKVVKGIYTSSIAAARKATGG